MPECEHLNPHLSEVLRKHAKAAGIDGKSFGPHALRATAATNALDWAPTWASSGMAGTRQRVDHPALRPTPLPARGQPHLPLAY
jgi:integrase